MLSRSRSKPVRTLLRACLPEDLLRSPCWRISIVPVPGKDYCFVEESLCRSRELTQSVAVERAFQWDGWKSMQPIRNTCLHVWFRRHSSPYNNPFEPSRHHSCKETTTGREVAASIKLSGDWKSLPKWKSALAGSAHTSRQLLINRWQRSCRITYALSAKRKVLSKRCHVPGVVKECVLEFDELLVAGLVVVCLSHVIVSLLNKRNVRLDRSPHIIAYHYTTIR